MTRSGYTLDTAAVGMRALEVIHSLVTDDHARSLPVIVLDAIREILKAVINHSQGRLTSEDAVKRINDLHATIIDNDANADAIRDARFPQK